MGLTMVVNAVGVFDTGCQCVVRGVDKGCQWSGVSDTGSQCVVRGWEWLSMLGDWHLKMVINGDRGRWSCHWLSMSGWLTIVVNCRWVDNGCQ